MVSIIGLFIFVPAFNVKGQETSSEVQSEVRVIRGLRDRRLFDLADVYLNEMLQSEAIEKSEKYLVYLEQIQLKVAWAIASGSNARADAWRQAESIISGFQKECPADPKLLLVQIQDALVNYSHGQLIQQELDAEIVTVDAKQIALNQFRIATTKLREIEKNVVAEIPAAPSKSVDGRLTQDQLINLKNNIRYRLAVINLAKSQLYEPSDRLNRVDALSQVLQRLSEVITQSNQGLPLWWDAQVSKAQCFRLMNNRQAFHQLILGLPSEFPNDEIKMKILTERVQAAVDFGNHARWQNLVKEYVQIDKPSPRLRLAVLKMLTTEASVSTGTLKQERQQQASELVKRIELDHGRYWGRRAEIILVGSVSPGNVGEPSSGDLDILVRQGNTSFRKKNFEDAVKAYAKAARFATQNDLGPQALATTVRLAQCYEQLGRHLEAANSLFESSTRFPQEPSADRVHLRGCWNLRQANKDNRNFVEKLRLQIDTWPESPSTDQARIWLGNTLELEKEWKSAIESYLSIEEENALSMEACQRARISVQQWLRQTEQDGGDTKQVAQKFLAMVNLSTDPPSDWTLPRQVLCAAAVEVGLQTGAISALQASYLLESIVLSDVQASDEILAWYVVATAKHVSQSKDETAVLLEAIKKLPNDSDVLKISMDGIKSCLNDHEKIAVAEAVAMICDKAIVAGDDNDKDYWLVEKAIADSQGADPGESLAGLAKLVETQPQSLRIQLAYARALSTAKHKTAIHQWRRIATKVKKGSEAWYEAKYNVVAIMIENGQKDEAVKLVNYLQVTTANWQQSKWNKRFLRLIK